MAEGDPQIVVTSVRRAEGPQVTQTISTPLGQPDVRVKVIHPLMRILMRSTRTGLQAILGSFSASGLINATGMLANVPFVNFKTALIIALVTGAASFVTTALQNLIEYLGEIDQKAPTWSS